MNILVYTLSAPLARGPRDLPAFVAKLGKCPFKSPIARALWGGFHADRLGYAFVAGYSAALSRLFEHAAPAETPPAYASLCATESGGAHPRAIATRLDKRGGTLVLDGEKTFATLATIAEQLLVVASRGIEADGKNRLRVVRVKPNAPGVSIVPRGELPFTPEIPHAVVRFTDVTIEDDDVLPGDGYDVWLKPFRTIEDTHVVASTVGYLLGAARAHDFGREAIAELASLAVALVDVAARPPDEPVTHIVLAGLFASMRRLIAALAPAWEKAPEDERTRWLRDQPILMVADKVRAKRTEAAWQSLTSPLPLRERGRG
ncbi:MAG: Acyl-CoA dehydrogenase [Labilithrix sp.]|nr:Acyl-CoA dehydrogenase [Labilithrix sp.]